MTKYGVSHLSRCHSNPTHISAPRYEEHVMKKAGWKWVFAVCLVLASGLALAATSTVPAAFPGTAHAVEHMMFRGSPGLSKDQLSAIAASMGGAFNADTTQGVTQYYFVAPAQDLEVALHIQALRMRGVDMREDQWQKERGAIEQEVSRDLSNPAYKFYEQMQAQLFAGTPYAHTPLGTRESFDKTTASMLKQFHDTWYAPNNAILVIA